MEWQGQTQTEGVDEAKPDVNWKAIYAEAGRHEKFIVTVEKWDKQKWISNKQMAYLHAVVFPTFAKEMFCSLLFAEITLKRACGEQWLIRRVDNAELILSKTVLSTNQCNEWFKNIWDWCESRKIHIPEPTTEQDWRKEVMP